MPIRYEPSFVDAVSVASAAATSADAHANAVSVRAVSISNELASLMTSADVALSARINTASALGTTADTHANTVSARAVSISAELASLMNSADTALSLRVTSVAGAAAAASMTSQEASVLIQVASAAATSADAHANAVSVRAVSVSAELASLIASGDAALSTRINTASALGTTADTHANTVSVRAVSISAELASLVNIASLAATSADGHANAVSIRAVSISNELGSLLASASTALAARDNTISAAAAAADTHANTVSVRAVSISAELASLVQIASLAATSADGHANTVSARAVSISNELGSLLASASTALNARITSVAGLAGGGGSVTSTELSVARYIPITTQTDVDYTASIGDALTLVKMSSASAHNFTVPPNASVAFPTGTQIVVEQAGAATVTIVAGAGVTLEGGPLTTLGQYSTVVLIKQSTNLWLVSNANAAGISTDIVSVINAVSLQALSQNNVISARVVSVSAEVVSLMNSGDAALSTRINTASTLGTTADTHANTVSARAVSISAELASLITSAAPRKAVNTANQASITVCVCSTVSGVSMIVSAGVTYTFEFQIPFTCMLITGLHVGVVGPACTTFNAQYQIPGAVGTTGIAPVANAVTPFYAQVRAIGTKVSTTSITLTGTTLVAYAWGTINPSATGSIKFIIGPPTSGGTNSGVIVLVGANLVVNRISG